MTDFFNPEEYEQRVKELYSKSMGNNRMSGPNYVICKSVFKEPCRLCQLSESFKRSMRNAGKPIDRDKFYGKSIRYFSNILQPNSPSTVLIFNYSQSILQIMLQLIYDPMSEYKNILSPSEGRNVIIRKIPGTTKLNTRFEVIPRANPSPLPDMKVLEKIYNLSDIPKNYEFYANHMLRQSSLPVGNTEIRFLPWLSGKYEKIFFFEIGFHFGISPETYKRIEDGEFNPYEEYEFKALKQEQFPREQSREQSRESKEFPQETQSKVTLNAPPCFGSFKEELVNERNCKKCEENKVMMACKLFTT